MRLEPPPAAEDLTDATSLRSEGAPDWLEDIAEPEAPVAKMAPSEADLTPDWLGEMASDAGDEDMALELPSFDFADEDRTVDAGQATSEQATKARYRLGLTTPNQAPLRPS